MPTSKAFQGAEHGDHHGESGTLGGCFSPCSEAVFTFGQDAQLLRQAQQRSRGQGALVPLGLPGKPAG